MKRGYWLALGGLILCVFVGLSLDARWQTRDQSGYASQRDPLIKLSYCDASDVRPCVVSFGLDGEGHTLVNLLQPVPEFPDIYLNITQGLSSATYACEPIAGFSQNVYCSGPVLQAGSAIDVRIYSVDDKVLLAEGLLQIVGLALWTPMDAIPTATETETETPTLASTVTGKPTVRVTGTPARATSTPTPTRQSYPKP